MDQYWYLTELVKRITSIFSMSDFNNHNYIDQIVCIYILLMIHLRNGMIDKHCATEVDS